MELWRRVGIVGPMATHAEGYAAMLAARGYSERTVDGSVRLTAQLSRWMAEQGRRTGDFGPALLEEFLAARRMSGRPDLTEVVGQRGVGQLGAPAAAGSRICGPNVDRTFHQLAAAAGLHPRSARCRPRIHDLRHGFAIRTLLNWYRDGLDVQVMLPRLSAYLGHANPANTYWYLSATPELLALAGGRLERAWEVSP